MNPCHCRPRCVLRLLAAFVWLQTAIWGQAVEPQEADFYRERVHPILKTHCLKCHGGEKIKGGLVLTSRGDLLRGGESGPAFDAGVPSKSLLLAMMSYKDDSHQMPPSGKRPQAEVETIERWLALGAPFDPQLEAPPISIAKEKPAPDSPANGGSPWWAYLPIASAVPPEAPDLAWSLNPVDAFLYKKLTENGLRPNPAATKERLIRRAYYDLLGLPPSPQEVKRFAEDETADAWPRLIEELLARPQYGEKWARHWMDLVRYAETDGFEYDSAKRNIWLYRDYLIESFNSDLPYDQFLTEQLAGDELEPPTRRSLTATGFLRLMQVDSQPADTLLAKYDILADNVQVTAETFLGMSMGCARCHDHKRDPISQRDYYNFMSFFHGLSEYRETRPRMWVEESEKERLNTEQRQRLSALDEGYQRLTRILLPWWEQQANPSGRFAQGSLVAPKPGYENAWLHCVSDPGPDWREETFAAKGWSSAALQGARPGQTVWMRARFGLSKIPQEFGIDLESLGETEVFLNGKPLLQARNLNGSSRFIDLGKRFRGLLHTGSNLVTVRTQINPEGRLPEISLFEGGSPLALAEGLLLGEKSTELPRLNQQAGGALLELLKRNQTAWWEEAQRPIGIPLNTVAESGAHPAALALHRRGNPRNLGETALPAFPLILSDNPQAALADVMPVADRSSGRRLALARWMVRPDNPLVSRVAVNRIWQHHFGRGLVPSPNEFGHLGERPTHPELLDHLASAFMKSGWSIKSMHRLLMNSQAYRMSSSAAPQGLAKDPENQLLWRFSMRRLTAEELRDSLLQVSGMLKKDSYGPPVYPPLPKQVFETQSRPGEGWSTQTSAQSARRSVYIHLKRGLAIPFLADHDQAPTDTPCAMRFVSTVPTQALGMLNSDFIKEQAHTFARRLQKESGPGLDAQIRLGLELVFQRAPSNEEFILCRQATDIFRSRMGLSEENALERFALIALNLNEFLYVD
jgi:hypothetical protein